MIWFPGAPVSVQTKPGRIRNVTSVEAAAEELPKFPHVKERDKAALVLIKALEGKATPAAARKAFEQAAKAARVWVEYRGPLA